MIPKYGRQFSCSSVPLRIEINHGLSHTPELGCKRIVFDSNYMKALHAPNLELNYDGIDKIVDDGILTKKGTWPEAHSTQHISRNYS